MIDSRQKLSVSIAFGLPVAALGIFLLATPPAANADSYCGVEACYLPGFGICEPDGTDLPCYETGYCGSCTEYECDEVGGGDNAYWQCVS